MHWESEPSCQSEVVGINVQARKKLLLSAIRAMTFEVDQSLSATAVDERTINAELAITPAMSIARTDPDRAMSMIFDIVNSRLLSGDLRGCDDILCVVDVSSLPYNVMLSFLTFTFAARRHLSQRSSLFHRIMERVIRDRGQEAAAKLLKTLA